MLLLVEILVLLGAMAFFWRVCLLKWQEALLEALGALDVELKKRHTALTALTATIAPFLAEKDAGLVTDVNAQLAKAERGIGKRDAREVIKHFREEARLDDMAGILLMCTLDYPQMNTDSVMLQRRADYEMACKNAGATLIAYNAAASELNKGIQLFPGPIIARFTKVSLYPFFEAAKAEVL